MGGHGYLDSSGVGRLFADHLPSVTYEGENFVLSLQVARAALKAFEATAATTTTTTTSRRQLSPSSAYLATLTDDLGPPKLTSVQDWKNLETQNRLLALRAAHCVKRLSERRQRRRRQQGGIKEEDESAYWSWESQKVAKAVVESYVASRLVHATTSSEGLLRRGLDARDRQVVNELVQLVHFDVPLPTPEHSMLFIN
jgi:acyl-CoA oxidase